VREQESLYLDREGLERGWMISGGGGGGAAAWGGGKGTRTERCRLKGRCTFGK
jgi:hypothetical protein